MATLNRRRFLAASMLAGSGMLTPLLSRAAKPVSRWPAYPFRLGVASGAPRADGFVLWTRLAPQPLANDPVTPGGMSGGDVALHYQISSDEAMRDIVRTGSAIASARFAHSVHVPVSGLPAGRPYWYRFRSGDAQSSIGRAVTLPARGATPPRLQLGMVSCANYEQGFFAAYRHLADEQPDLVLYLGDYIYEYVDRRSTDLVRRHSDDVEATDLYTYRNRYAQYRLDADLQRLHATAPALLTWDDHEVANDYGDLRAATFGDNPVFSDPAQFRQRRAAAYQAFYEHMPLPPLPQPQRGDLRIYNHYQLGSLLEIFMTDARQYRSAAPCYGPPDHVPGRLITAAECAELNDSRRSLLGGAQERWLQRSITQSQARWNLFGQSLLMAPLRRRTATGEPLYWTDDWNGYPVSRQRLLQHIHDSGLHNPVMVGGDAHTYFANELRLAGDDPDAAPVATEFVGTSISAKPGSFDFASLQPDNPHIRYTEARYRGYLSVSVEKTQLTTRMRAISDARDPQATVHTLKEFVVADGKPGLVP